MRKQLIVLTIIVFYLYNKSFAQDVRVIIELDKDNFDYMERIHPQITICNDSEKYLLFSSSRFDGPGIKFELYDRNDVKINFIEVFEEYWGDPNYFAILPSCSIIIPISGYYFIPDFEGVFI